MKSREQFLTKDEFEMLVTSKCSTPHYVRAAVQFLSPWPPPAQRFLNLASTSSENTELSLVQLLGVLPTYILNLAGDCFACMRAMGCIEAVYALKKVYSIYISCESSTPSVLVIQESISFIPIAATPHLYMQHTVCLLSALSLCDTSQQLMITLAISPQSTPACSAWMCSFGAKVTEGKVRQIAQGLILQLSQFFVDVSFTFDPSEMTRLQLNGEHFKIPLWHTISSHLYSGSANDSPGSKMPKPPWLLCFVKMQVIGEFLLEVPQWFREYVVLVI
jgi:hypothetical protein